MSSATLDRPHAAAQGERRFRCRTLFSVPFETPMSDVDLHRLSAPLGLDCDVHSKLHPGVLAPAVRRLDFESGLFLMRGAGEDEWRLEGRTWGTPAPESVHLWHLWAADGARLLDAAVPIPPSRPPR
jgi:hypothetical protein